MKKIVFLFAIVIAVVFIPNFCQALTLSDVQKVNESTAYLMSLLDDDMTEGERAIIIAQYTQE